MKALDDVELRAHGATELQGVVVRGGLEADLLDTEVTDAAEETWGHRPAGRLDALGGARCGEPGAELGDAAVADQDVGVLAARLRRVRVCTVASWMNTRGRLGAHGERGAQGRGGEQQAAGPHGVTSGAAGCPSRKSERGATSGWARS